MTLTITQPLQLRSASYDPASVRILGTGTFAPLLFVRSSDVTVASVTLSRSLDELVIVEPMTTDITGVLFYDVTFEDAGGPRFRTRSTASLATGPYSDNGRVACSRFVPTLLGCQSVALWGIAADAARDWVFEHNVFDWRACNATSFRTIGVDFGSRDTIVRNNLFLESNYGIMFGGSTNGRTYNDPLPTPCSGTPDHRGGLICNNVIASRNAPFDPVVTFEEGIAVWSGCHTWVMHNTVVGPAVSDTWTTLEHRFGGSYVHFVNNVSSTPIMGREGSTENPETAASNYVYGSYNEFVDVNAGDLRFAGTPPTGMAISMCTTDAAGKPRSPSTPHVGAFEP